MTTCRGPSCSLGLFVSESRLRWPDLRSTVYIRIELVPLYVMYEIQPERQWGDENVQNGYEHMSPRRNFNSMRAVPLSSQNTKAGSFLSSRRKTGSIVTELLTSAARDLSVCRTDLLVGTESAGPSLRSHLMRDRRCGLHP